VPQAETLAPPSHQRAPAWAVRLATVIPLLVLPTALWRLAWVFEQPVGWDPVLFAENTDDLHEKVYLFGVTVLSEALALLSLGLVHRWGEVLPRWVPFLGGRRIPPLVAVVPAAAGAIALLLIWTPLPVMFLGAPQSGAPDGNGWELLMAVCYLPLVAWGPFLAAITWAYYRRRTRSGGRPPS